MRCQLSFTDRLFSPEGGKDRAVLMQRYERIAYQEGATYVAGVDEAGRGCLAGPVVAAAVIFPKGLFLSKVNDSKQLTKTQRESLFPCIQEHALSVGVGMIPAETIDRINILQATYLAMEEAIANLVITPDYLLLDAVSLSRVPIRQKGIKKGDSLSVSIAAASIIAKVTRDRLMLDYAEQFPCYGFEQHKGYGTKKHRESIAVHGPCPIHRSTFRGVKEYLPSS
ncbi:ribonuclease HII [candidate division KSB3 bacterium]|uniref:Ribonuclease HII n=1 Tax=candidate division KSB3 bacterium TaxID=2044937 RepID=A0A2G6E3Y0_9BACT|nr:MAG: ribonuclease HII [candidate division KSB3 bacterium]PIE29179.1 MAG: ribonuclease HII [candidate division KSB3 bacterium]